MEKDFNNNGDPAAFRKREKQKGRLKIFLGILPGVGKTSAMLRTAQVEAANDRKIMIGFATWQTRPDTVALVGSLPVIPPRIMENNGGSSKEMNTDAILEIHPDVVLIADPSHTNVPGSRHLKRYHDIQEILDHGIDVFTTLNVMQLESYLEFQYEIMGFAVPTVPDDFLGRADDVELVDVEPDELIKRQREGKIHVPGIPDKVIENIYQEEKITAIRKKFFRMTVDRENWYKQHVYPLPKIRMRLLAPIWPDTITTEVIRRSRAMAVAIDTGWVALYIETNRKLTDREKTQLEDNIRYARQLGGTLVTYTGNDPVEAIIEVSHRERISHIVLGRTNSGWIAGTHRRNYLKRLLKYGGRFNISIICGETLQDKKKHLFNINKPIPGLSNRLITVVASLITGVLCTVLDNKILNDAPPYIALLLLFMLAGPMRANSGLVASAIALLTCIVLVVPPTAAFPINFIQDIPMLLLFCTISLLNGFLTVRLRTHEREAYRREKQTNALFQLTKKLSEANNIGEVVVTSMENIRTYFDATVFFIFRDADYQLTNFKYAPEGLEMPEKEMEAASWAFDHHKPTGRFTDVMSSGMYTFYPLTGKGLKIGVLVAKLDKSFSAKDNISWDAFLSQISQSLEHQYLEMTTRRTDLLSESDRLYKTLFNSISHELRIPIATIIGASDMILESKPPEHIREELFGEILSASQRLNRLVENLLNMSRLESGRIAVHPDWCDIRDLFNRIASTLEEELRPFHFEMSIPESMPLVRIDYGLMEQAVFNLTYNATLYAPPGTDIELNACFDNNFLVIQVFDRGPGFDPDSLKHLFDKFWRPKDGKSGGLGLGLSIVKGFVEAHNGVIYAQNREDGGACFTIMIFMEKLDYETGKGLWAERELLNN